MATFVYEAMREPGEVIKGELDAEDATAAASSLIGRGYHVIRVSAGDKSGKLIEVLTRLSGLGETRDEI
ncbi:MAG: hypothetical protein NTZ09_00215, partial [Candidatus Hydrogenedentes bacterium]|nr:hypothetical protein [Candidatus Hydrogenedentota bacterium]